MLTSAGERAVSGMKRLVVMAGILWVLGASAAAQKNDWLVVPGSRVGPITAATTRAELDTLFGKENVQDGSYQAEDVEAATIVFGSDSSAALAVTWNNERVSYVYVCFQTKTGPCRWRTASGIRIGLPIRELQRLNGKAFQMAGFGFDGQGAVKNWRKGALEQEEGACGHLVVRLTPLAEIEGRPMSKDEASSLKAMQGDKSFASSYVATLGLDPIVSDLIMEFTGPGCGKWGRMVGGRGSLETDDQGAMSEGRIVGRSIGAVIAGWSPESCSRSAETWRLVRDDHKVP